MPAVYNILNGCNSGYMFFPLLCSQMNPTLLSNGTNNTSTFQFQVQKNPHQVIKIIFNGTKVWRVNLRNRLVETQSI
jgi:hypothetical protein